MRRSLPLLLLFILTAPALAQVAIHEILYDGVGTDPDDVFTELTGPARLRLDGWSLEAVNGGTGEVYRSIPLDDVEIPADGVLLIATSSATGVVLEQRDLIASVDWQNGPDAVRLVDPDGQIADALQYGDAAEHNAGEGMPAATTAAGQSLSRDDLGTDTGDNAADFTISTPTPGAAIVPLPPGA
ncbi:MAG: lamin tail domain-containing protein, partial [Gemmatimonadetes bacterium]|nr:lamin tail domain-containing protein [Gemmatimonadota bacterium]